MQVLGLVAVQCRACRWLHTTCYHFQMADGGWELACASSAPAPLPIHWSLLAWGLPAAPCPIASSTRGCPRTANCCMGCICPGTRIAWWDHPGPFSKSLASANLAGWVPSHGCHWTRVKRIHPQRWETIWPDTDRLPWFTTTWQRLAINSPATSWRVGGTLLLPESRRPCPSPASFSSGAACLPFLPALNVWNA